MKSLNLDEVREYVNENVVDFHQRKVKSLEELRLKLLTKNPYLFKAKNITTAGELIANLLEAFLSSSEEKLFGDFLEGLAVFVAQWSWSFFIGRFIMWCRSNRELIGETVRSKINLSRI